MSVDLKTTQAQLLTMMMDIDEFCKKYDIAYSLTGGSLLGAIRHQGFIPWDDDIDIMVTRENYQKILCHIDEFAECKMGRGNWLQYFEKRDGSLAAHVDIFIMDNLPDNRFCARMKLFMLKVLQGMLKQQPSSGNFSFIHRVCLVVTRVIGKLFSRKFLLKLYDKVSQIGNKKQTEYISLANDGFRQLKYKHKYQMMNEFVSHKFENTEFSITTMFHEYLTTRYGDYMTPPSQIEQVPTHSCKE